MAKVVITYEPVWAMVNLMANHANGIHVACCAKLTELYGKGLAENTAIQYGDSIKLDNVAAVMVESDITGALVARAYPEADSFAMRTKF